MIVFIFRHLIESHFESMSELQDAHQFGLKKLVKIFSSGLVGGKNTPFQCAWSSYGKPPLGRHVPVIGLHCRIKI